MMRLRMQYAGAEWIAHNSRMQAGSMSPLGIVVADALGFVYRGIYHLPPSLLERVEWFDERYIAISVPRDLCTWDGNELTRLVVICHDLMLRMEVDPAGPYHLRLSFYQRRARTGSISARMPTLEEHAAMIRAGYTIDDDTAAQAEPERGDGTAP